MKKLIFAITVFASAALLQSCHTVAGVGNDLSKFGTGVTNTASGKTWDGQALQRRVAPPLQVPTR